MYLVYSICSSKECSYTKYKNEFWLSLVEFEFLLLLYLRFKAHILKTESPTAGASLIIGCELSPIYVKQ